MVHFCLVRWLGCCCSCRLCASLEAHSRARQSYRSAVLRMLSPIVSKDHSGNCLLPYQLEKLLSLWAICWAWWPRCCCSCRLRASLVARCRARRVTYQRRFASLLVSSPLSSFPPAPLYLLLSFIFFVGFLVLSSVLPPPSVPPPLFISPFSLLSPLLVSRVFFFPCPFCSLAFSFVSFCASPCAPLGILSLKIGRERGAS